MIRIGIICSPKRILKESLDFLERQGHQLNTVTHSPIRGSSFRKDKRGGNGPVA